MFLPVLIKRPDALSPCRTKISYWPGTFVRAGDLRGNLAERRHLFYGCEAHELEVLEGAVQLNNTGDCRRIVESETSKMAKTLGPLLTVP